MTGIFLSLDNFPNLLTLSRIILLPVFAAAFIYTRYDLALIIFFIGGCTDLLDGLIARLTKKTTEFGRILDPIADKFFLLTSFMLMSVYGILPKWISIIVISRDLIVVTGCIVIYFLTNHLRIEPSLLGKVTIAAQFILIGYALLTLNLPHSREVPEALVFTVALLTTASGLQYVYQGMKIAAAASDS